MNKICSKCNIEKPLSDFHKHNGSVDGLRGQCKQCRCEIDKQYKLSRHDQILENKKKYYQLNKQEIVKKAIDYELKKVKVDPSYKLLRTLRRRCQQTIAKGFKSESTIKLLGCTIDEARKHIESLWVEGMTWDNHGFGDDKWHIDHIIPCDSFDLTKGEEQHKCFHFTNLQPLWQHDNLSKSNNIL